MPILTLRILKVVINKPSQKAGETAVAEGFLGSCPPRTLAVEIGLA